MDAIISGFIPAVTPSHLCLTLFPLFVLQQKKELDNMYIVCFTEQ